MKWTPKVVEVSPMIKSWCRHPFAAVFYSQIPLMYITFWKTHQTRDRRFCAVWVCIYLYIHTYRLLIYILHVEAPSFWKMNLSVSQPSFAVKTHCEAPTKALPFPMPPPPRARAAALGRTGPKILNLEPQNHMGFQPGIQPLFEEDLHFQVHEFQVCILSGVTLIHQLWPGFICAHLWSVFPTCFTKLAHPPVREMLVFWLMIPQFQKGHTNKYNQYKVLAGFSIPISIYQQKKNANNCWCFRYPANNQPTSWVAGIPFFSWGVHSRISGGGGGVLPGFLNHEQDEHNPTIGCPVGS